ncbi:MAG TPA: ATP-binding protein [Vicinamibacterales bacterium]|jgi:PAS domain S-box-containing protein
MSDADTRRKAVEEALRESEERYRSLIHGAAYGIYRSTLDGRLLDVNPALATMLGYDSMEELQGLNLREVYRHPDERDALIERYGRDGVARGIEVDWKRRNGTPVRVRLSVRVVRTPADGDRSFEGIVEDVSERRALEARLHQAQQMEAVGRLARGIAHDFNNVLAAIEGSCDLLLAQLAPDDPSHPEIVEIQRAAERGASLTRRLLAFSRREPVRSERLDVRTVVNDMAGMLRRLTGEGHTFEIREGDEPLWVLAEASQIEQVLLNLVVNARDAMPKAGRLTIRLDRVETDETTASPVGPLAGPWARLTIEDTGIGIALDRQAQIFEPFYTTKDPDRGGGLGLSIVYSIVRECGGSIRVTSEPGRGTRFDILLPLV